MGEKTYTIDLRKALPSTFLRPCSQHGWVVRGKDVSYDFDSQISCVIRVNIDLAKEMLGSGTLLSQENFFPDETIDQGYNILLERQKGSRLKSKFEKVILSEMITDFGRFRSWEVVQKNLQHFIVLEVFGRSGIIGFNEVRTTKMIFG